MANGLLGLDIYGLRSCIGLVGHLGTALSSAPKKWTWQGIGGEARGSRGFYPKKNKPFRSTIAIFVVSSQPEPLDRLEVVIIVLGLASSLPLCWLGSFSECSGGSLGVWQKDVAREVSGECVRQNRI